MIFVVTWVSPDSPATLFTGEEFANWCADVGELTEISSIVRWERTGDERWEATS